MLRFKTLIAVSIAAAHPALAATPTQYGEGEGERFEYTTELRANGFVHIAGVALGSRQPFVLDLSPAGNVGGYFRDAPVEYHVSREARDAGSPHVAQAPA